MHSGQILGVKLLFTVRLPSGVSIGNPVRLWGTRPANKRALSARNDSRRVRIMDSSIKTEEKRYRRCSSCAMCKRSTLRIYRSGRSREIDRFFSFLFLINLILGLIPIKFRKSFYIGCYMVAKWVILLICQAVI